MGVECDGATYHSAATARDRDKVRSEILRGLGWHLVRVWSTEWWVDREGALERLHQAIGTILESERADTEKAAAAAVEGIAIAERDIVKGTDQVNKEVTPPVVMARIDDSEIPQIRLVARGPDHARDAPVRRAYCKADFAGLKISLRPDLFQDSSYDATLETLIRCILEQEAPMHDKLLVDRVARAHGFKRSGRLIREHVLEITERHHYFRQDPQRDHGNFVWLSVEDPERWNCYRIPDSDDDIRLIKEISFEELSSATRAIRGDCVFRRR